MTAPLQIPNLDLITPELLAQYDCPGPRYTSYPTAVEFHPNFGPKDYREQLQKADKNSDGPLSLYIHIPFCKEKCSFCGCNSSVAQNRETVDKYLDSLFAELDMLAAWLPNRRTIMQYHWGGGTPTSLSTDQITALSNKVKEHFIIGSGAEVAVEVNPGVTSPEKLALLRDQGFNRVSFGVQDFNPQVLKAICRNQTEKQVQDLFRVAKDLQFESINIDLIYGLPHQTLDGFRRTIGDVLNLRPDRVAMYSFAYIPRIMKNQESILQDVLPKRDTKFSLFAEAIRQFLDAGYLQIGMDHFALPDDEMGKAVTKGKLYRNFMGYTVHRATDMLGVGASSIGAVEGAFVQNHKDPNDYTDAINASDFPTAKGYVLTEDDRIRQRVITELMCNFRLHIPTIEKEFNIDFNEYFQLEKIELRETLIETDLPFLGMDDIHMEINPIGRLFVRNICMIFDRHLRDKHKDTPMFSRTI